jgi:hypothetical protein
MLVAGRALGVACPTGGGGTAMCAADVTSLAATPTVVLPGLSRIRCASCRCANTTPPVPTMSAMIIAQRRRIPPDRARAPVALGSGWLNRCATA